MNNLIFSQQPEGIKHARISPVICCVGKSFWPEYDLDFCSSQGRPESGNTKLGGGNSQRLRYQDGRLVIEPETACPCNIAIFERSSHDTTARES